MVPPFTGDNEGYVDPAALFHSNNKPTTPEPEDKDESISPNDWSGYRPTSADGYNTDVPSLPPSPVPVQKSASQIKETTNSGVKQKPVHLLEALLQLRNQQKARYQKQFEITMKTIGMEHEIQLRALDGQEK